MQVQARAREQAAMRANRRLYLPTILIAGLAAWLSWRGWTALAQTGIARSMDARRYQLAGPVVLGFLAVVTDNTATPAVVFTVYACLGALPHANLRWTYGGRGWRC